MRTPSSLGSSSFQPFIFLGWSSAFLASWQLNTGIVYCSASPPMASRTLLIVLSVTPHFRSLSSSLRYHPFQSTVLDTSAAASSASLAALPVSWRLRSRSNSVLNLIQSMLGTKPGISPSSITGAFLTPNVTRASYASLAPWKNSTQP